VGYTGVATFNGVPGVPRLTPLVYDELRRMARRYMDQLWIADITYIPLEIEFVFLAVMLDAYSRLVIGWALERTLEDKLTIAELRMALSRRAPARGLMPARMLKWVTRDENIRD
jgi:transposase InsO family protein